MFGALWAAAAVAFTVAGVAMLAGWAWWQPALLVAALISLAVTTLDWSLAFTGAIVNVLILAALWLGPRIAAWLAG